MNAGYMDDVEAQINFGNIAGYWQGVRMPLLVDFQLQGTEVDASAYIRNHPTTFSNRFDSSFMGQVKVVYDNGTIVCVNRNPYKKWNLILGSSGGWYNYHALINNIDSLQTGISDSTTYLLPARNGWVVYAPQ